MNNWLLNYWETYKIFLTIPFIFAFTIIIISFCAWRLFHHYTLQRTAQQIDKSLSSEISNARHTKPRLRKRDRIRLQMERISRLGLELTKDPTQGRQLLEKLVKKVRGQKSNTLTTALRRHKLPDNFLEPCAQEEDSQASEMMLLLMRSIRVFGHIERFSITKLTKYIETVNLKKDEMLFQIGDLDDNIYVILQGRIRVFITENGVEHPIHDAAKGDNIHSLLSVLDVLTGHPRKYRTVSARALVPSEVLRLPASAFVDIFEGSPASMIRLVQVIAVRLQRVTFMALHNYLGLSSELMSSDCLALPKSAISSLQNAQLLHRQLWTKSGVARSLSRGTEESLPAPHLNVIEGLRSCTSSPACSSLIPQGEFADFDAVEARAISTMNPENVELGDMPAPRSASSRRRRSLRSKSKTSMTPILELNDDIILKAVITDLVHMLELSHGNLLKSMVSLQRVTAGSILIKEGDCDTDLFFVVTGQLNMIQRMIDNRRVASLYQPGPGEIVGLLAVLTGEPSFFAVRADQDSLLAVITRRGFYTLLREEPRVMLNSGHLLVRRMSNFVRQIDFALDWISIDAGKPLYNQGDDIDYVYIVLNGRLRQICEDRNGVKRVVGEYGQGEWLGFLEMPIQKERATTVYAIRDSELARIPSDLLNFIKRKQPSVLSRLVQLLSNKMLSNLTSTSEMRQSNAVAQYGQSAMNVTVNSNVRTVAILAANERVSLDAFTLELQHTLTSMVSSRRLTSGIVRRHLGEKAFDSMNDFRLTTWLAQQEETHKMILYQCDSSDTTWTRRCLRQADRVLVVGRAEDAATPLGLLESDLGHKSLKVAKTLVLLHRESTDYPPVGLAAAWLNAREWCTLHFHVRAPDRMFQKHSLLNLENYYKRISQLGKPDVHSDMSRLARGLAGHSVGLVLGGGGARGCSHVGVIRALKEAGVPIDMVGGTSIGAFMAALYAEDTLVDRFERRAQDFSREMTSVWKRVIDLTYPATSFFSGKSFNAGIQNVFKDRCIEDLWLPYFCITTDISNSKMKVHTSGSTWRYVRASMSLSGYLPPLCDPDDGALLLDGGYVNNLPADIMQVNMGAARVFAVDVGSQDDTNLTNFGDSLSGWWLLWKRLNPWTTPIKVPNQQDIQSRLAYVSCVRQLEEVKHSEVVCYMRPPVDSYGTLQFGSFRIICEIGYQYCKKLLAECHQNEADESWLGMFRNAGRRQSASSMKTVASLNELCNNRNLVADEDVSITDLAEMVSRGAAASSEESPHFALFEQLSTCSESDHDDDAFDYESDCTEYTRMTSAVHRRRVSLALPAKRI